LFRDSVTGKLKTLEFLNPILSNLIKGSPTFVTNAFVLGKEKFLLMGKLPIGHILKRLIL